MPELQLKGKSYTPVRFKLRKWLEYEKSQEAILSAVADHKVEQFSRLLYRLVSTALNISEDVSDAPWFEIVQAYSTITNINRAKEIPMLKSDPTKPKDKDAPWEYDGRDWFWWVNLFAKNYGWTVPIIEEMDIDDSVSLLQEILVDEQLKQEWEWQLSETGWEYDETIKKSKLRPLDRPAWMKDRPVNLPATKVRFRKSMLPVGAIIGENGNERIAT